MDVDRSHKTAEAPLSVGAHAIHVKFVDVSVLATRVELACVEFERADEASSVRFDGAHAGSLLCIPLVDQGVGATGIGMSIVTEGNSGEGCHWVSIVDTLSLVEVTCVSIPEVDVLGSSSGKHVGLGAETNVMDLVLVTLTLALESHITCGFIDANIVVIVEINAGDEGGIMVEGDSGHTSGSFWKLSAALFLSAGCTPGENGWL